MSASQTFVRKCVELQFLKPDQADDALAEAASNQTPVETLVVRRGWMTPELVDIAESLCNPTEIAPGYELLDVLGRGGMGVVYRARQLDLNRIVAIKTILLSSMSNPNVAKRFEREAMAIARLQHPGIVQAWNFGQHNHRYYLAMEYVDGRSCDQVISGGRRLPPTIAWSFVRQVAAGLSHAHSHGVIHRDIKPANLLVTSPPEGSSLPTGADMIKIADFGLAVLADSDQIESRITTDNALVGSPAYMSPEQFGGEDVDFRSDIYSLGVTALNLLTGQTPFATNSLVQLAGMKKTGLAFDDPQLASLPSDQADLIRAMIAPTPNDRPQSYRDLIDRIERLQFAEGPQSPATGEAMTETLQFDSSDVFSSGSLSGNPPSDAASNPTIQLENADRPAPSKRRPRILTSLIAIGIAGLLVAGMMTWMPWNETGDRSFTKVTTVMPLFDGMTLAGWDVGGTMVGAWNVVESPDDSTSIACLARRGAITRRLPDWPHQRISLFVYLSKSDSDSPTATDIDFGFQTARDAVPHPTFRVTDKTIELGFKQGDFGDFEAWHQHPAPDTINDRYHVIDIERQDTDWYVFFEQQFIGTLPIDDSEIDDSENTRKQTGANMLRLVVAGNDPDHPKVHFADLQSSQLANVSNPVATDTPNDSL
ncbi:MAG: serine/threonine-protein kinase [Rubripirellula sp.]